MFRTLAAVILGYVVAVAVTIVGIFASWSVFGVEGAFAENSTVGSTSWALTTCVIGFVGAVAAGATAAVVGKHPDNQPVKLLAGLMLALALVIAALTMGVEPAPVPAEWASGEVTFAEAGEVATNPVWYNWVIGFVGAAGVMVGGNLVGRSDE